ncbi:hypothetical protein B0H15DRAFT_908519 [Mycena belliarum]|uniref:Glycosyltransferase family 25 protein n=1 Tax=Mycena belliarum TaxID=1033014 RepID=A0AAD6XQW3_9AGAR|nr:hypothetical protein B0H15DRAFT_908519 [Mycena belliae]
MFSSILARNLALLIFVAAIALLFIYIHALNFFPPALSLTNSPDLQEAGRRILPIPASTYVISLPRRKDRHGEMERLRSRLGVHWDFIPAEDSQSPLVGRIMTQVRTLRQEELKVNGHLPNATISLPFQWPNTSVTPVPFEDLLSPSPNVPSASDTPLTCATANFTLVPYSQDLPEYNILSRNRIACWHSHLSAIRRAASHAPEKAALVLEDDVDMEVDINARLLGVWNLLPPDWDIVYLGHCWSNESLFPALGPPGAPTRLHPSRAPLCTHAYALSSAGARTLLLHLTYPRFAYSRAIDHALAWLVQSGRLKSFSLVPSVVIQRKVGRSDVMPGTGSKWRDRLVHGVLD